MTIVATAPDALFWRDVGTRVAVARRTAGFTHEDLERCSGVKLDTIKSLEYGRARVSVLDLMRLHQVIPFVLPELPVADRNETISALTARVDELTTTVNNLRARIRKARADLGPPRPDERERE